MLTYLLTRPRLYRLIVALLIVAVASAMFGIFLQTFELNGDSRFTLTMLMTGTAYKPFVYRVLIPGIIRLVSAATTWPPPAVATGVMYLSLLVFAFSLRFFISRFITEKVLADLATIFGLVGLYFSFYFAKVYDFPALAFFTIGLICLHNRRWLPYAVLFPIACLCKETMILLVLVFALHYWDRLDRQTYFGLLAYQAITFVIIRLVLTWVFRDNPGGALEFHLFDHIKAFLSQPIFFSLWLLALIGVAAIVIYRWREKPLFLRHAAIATALPLLVLFFASGGPYEVRNLYEAYPAVFLLGVYSIRGISTNRVTTAS